MVEVEDDFYRLYNLLRWKSDQYDIIRDNAPQGRDHGTDTRKQDLPALQVDAPRKLRQRLWRRRNVTVSGATVEAAGPRDQGRR